MKKLFTLFKMGDLFVPANRKVIPGEEFFKLLSAEELLQNAEKEALQYRSQVAAECERLKEEAQKAGFEEGLSQFNTQIAHLENETKMQKEKMQKKISTMATAAVKKIIGRELVSDPEIIVDLVSTALKSVSQHRKISIYVNKLDLEQVEKNRARIKAVFEHVDSLTISARDDVAPGGCIIETEAGIINAQLDSQIKALEQAFERILKTEET